MFNITETAILCLRYYSLNALNCFNVGRPSRPLTGKRLDVSRHVSDFPKGTSRNQVWRSPATHSFVLQPVNMTPAFTESNTFEDAKLKLSDFNTDVAYWQEVPQKRGNGKTWDNFLNFVLDSKKVPANYPYHETGSILSDIGLASFLVGTSAKVPNKSFANNTVLKVINSKNSFDYNQGFCIRFYFEGRSLERTGSVFRFQFGEYLLSLDSTGQADLYQSAEFCQLRSCV